MLKSAHPAPSAGVNLVEDAARVEAALWYRLRIGGDAGARIELFQRFFGFARQTARRERGRRPVYGLELADLEQLATEALLESIDRFDPDKGVPFEAFARMRIRGAIANGIAKSSEGAAVYSARQRMLRDRMGSLKQPPASNPSGSTLERLADIVLGLAVSVLLDEAVAELDAATAASFQQTPLQGPLVRDLQRQALSVAQGLDEPDRSIILRHYRDGIPFAQIAEIHQLSRGRISQLHQRALQAIRMRLEDPGD